jgi:hypothetical protein
MSKLVFLTIIGLAASAAAAQGNSTIGSPATANGALERIVTGAPFSAESISEVVQTAVDGSHVKHTSTAVTIIRDPVGGVRYLMDSREIVARRELIPTAASGQGGTAGSQPWSAKEAAIKVARQSVKSMLSTRSAAVSQTLHTDATPLGDQVFDGVTASGARVSAVVPAGQIGNDKPLTFSSEAWYSPDLGIIVMSKVSDPVSGDTNVRLTKLQRGEPNPDLFAVPAGYRIVVAGIPSEPGAQRAKE